MICYKEKSKWYKKKLKFEDYQSCQETNQILKLNKFIKECIEEDTI